MVVHADLFSTVFIGLRVMRPVTVVSEADLVVFKSREDNWRHLVPEKCYFLAVPLLVGNYNWCSFKTHWYRYYVETKMQIHIQYQRF